MGKVEGDAMKINVGSIVTHPLFLGPGVVMNIHNENGKQIVQVMWQSMGRYGFHSLDHLELITENFFTENE